MDERQDYRVFWLLMLALLLLTRVPATAAYLSIDNVNLAFSLEKFDPRIHQPQPPGYPFFVGFARIVNFFFRDAERTFLAIALLVSGLCLPLAVALGARMFSRWAGMAAAFLLLVNPVFWFGGLDGPLRPFLALFSLLTAYCCWRCWNGEKRFAVWGALVLGAGTGFRPDLMVLFPLWLVSAWVGTKSWRAVLEGCVVMGAVVLVWVGSLGVAMGGIETVRQIMVDYAVEQSRDSVVFGNPLLAWLRQINRLVIWNGIAMVTWIWALPFYFRNRGRLPILSSQGVFFFIWLLPGFIFQAFIHVEAPGHTLASVAALCLLGGYVVSMARARDLILAAALVLNAMLFLDYFSLPPGVAASPNRVPSVKNAMLFGTFETSIGQLRWLDDLSRNTLNEIDEFTPQGRPSMIVTTDSYVERWFLNWRIARYYRPDRDFWVLYRKGRNYGVQHVRREAYLEKLENTFVRLPVPTDCRILWLIEPGSEVHKQIASQRPVSGGRWVFYTDITGDATPIKLDGVEIAPMPFLYPSKPGEND